MHSYDSYHQVVMDYKALYSAQLHECILNDAVCTSVVK